MRLDFLAPDLQRATIAGTQPADLNLDQPMPLPVDWNEQRKIFAS